MTNKKYISGAEFERFVKKDLERQNAWVIRSAGSHGEADLIVMWVDGSTWAVSCKKYGVFPANEKRRLIEKCNKYGRVPMLVYKNKHQKGYLIKKVV